MSEPTEKSPVFTGLILLTGDDAPGAARGLFGSLSEFAIQVIDVEQIVINSRLIMTMLITLNPAHQSAIETDLNFFAEKTGFDVATIFSEQTNLPALQPCIGLEIVAKKMHPMLLMTIAKGIEDLKANIESITRINHEDFALLFKISGADLQVVTQAMNELNFESTPAFRVFTL